MDHSERIASEYLSSRGFRDIVYEPDGNVSPDFLINGCIAVEVRRLNQNEETADGWRGLEETAIPLQAKISRLLGDLGSSDGGDSWYVAYSFRRPLLPWPELADALRLELGLFRRDPEHQSTTRNVAKGFGSGCLEPGDVTPNSSCPAAIPMAIPVASSSPNRIGIFASASPRRPRRSHACVRSTRIGGFCSWITSLSGSMVRIASTYVSCSS